MKYTVGSRVLTLSGYEGLIKRVYDDFSAIAYTLGRRAGEWQALQEPSLTTEELAEPWYLVYADSGGSLWVPESRVSPESPV